MVRRGSTVRVRQRASIKCLQIGALSLSVRRTHGHISDTSAVRATHRDVSRPYVVRSSEKMVEADFDPPADPRNFSRADVALAGVHDVAQRLQALGQKPRRLAVTMGVVAAARTMVVTQRNVNAERAAR